MKKNSWHYGFAKLGNNGHSIDSGDMSICTYIRKVVMGIGIAGVLTLMVSGFVIWLVWALWEIVGATFGFAEMGPAAGVFIAIGGLFALTYLWTVAKEKWDNKSKQLLKKENASLASSVYKSYKEKICFKVDFE